MSRNARILGTAMHAPERVVPNEWFDEQLGEDVSTWLEENLTIRERRWCAEDESAADLSTAAAEKALAAAGVSAEEIDLIVLATDTPEFVSPATATVVQHRLGAKRAGCFDLNAACAGFVTALDLGARYIRMGDFDKVLVIGAYAMSKYLDMADKKTVTLFADGAGAVVLGAGEGERGWLAGRLHAEGQYNEWMGIYAGATKTPVDDKVLASGEHRLRFVRKFPKELNPEIWTRMIREVLGDIDPSDVGMFFFTQININSIRETLNNLGLPMSRTHTVMDRYGYTGSACIPMALAEADAAGKLKENDLVVFMGSGGGLAFAAAAFRW